MKKNKIGKIAYIKDFKIDGGDFSGVIYNGKFTMKPDIQNTDSEKYRKYSIKLEPIFLKGYPLFPAKGEICEVVERTNKFRNYCCRLLNYAGKEYIGFPLDFHSSKYVTPIYHDAEQISQIEWCEKDRLHTYHVYALNEDAIIISVYFACYDFLLFRHPFTEHIDGPKILLKNYHKDVLKKYNPNFVNEKIREK